MSTHRALGNKSHTHKRYSLELTAQEIQFPTINNVRRYYISGKCKYWLITFKQRCFESFYFTPRIAGIFTDCGAKLARAYYVGTISGKFQSVYGCLLHPLKRKNLTSKKSGVLGLQYLMAFLGLGKS